MSEATSETALELAGIVKTFEQGGNRLEVLRGASLSLSAGETVALGTGQVDVRLDGIGDADLTRPA